MVLRGYVGAQINVCTVFGNVCAKFVCFRGHVRALRGHVGAKRLCWSSSQCLYNVCECLCKVCALSAQCLRSDCTRFVQYLYNVGRMSVQCL